MFSHFWPAASPEIFTLAAPLCEYAWCIHVHLTLDDVEEYGGKQSEPDGSCGGLHCHCLQPVRRMRAGIRQLSQLDNPKLVKHTTRTALIAVMSQISVTSPYDNPNEFLAIIHPTEPYNNHWLTSDRTSSMLCVLPSPPSSFPCRATSRSPVPGFTCAGYNTALGLGLESADCRLYVCMYVFIIESYTRYKKNTHTDTK